MDWSAIDVKRGAIGVAGIIVAVVFIGVLGPAGLMAGLCALFLGLFDERGARRDRLATRAQFVVVGAALIVLLSWSGEEAWSAALVATVVTFCGTLAAGWGRKAAAEGQFLVLLTVVVLMVGPTDQSAVELAVAFVLGGLVATAISLVGGHWAGTESVDVSAATEVDSPSVGDVVRSEIGIFAGVRALAVGAATGVGYQLFDDHPVWTMLTVVLVLQTPARQTMMVGLQRMVGTVVGVLVGMVIVNWLDTGNVAVSVAFVLAGFGMITFKGVSGTLSTVFMTCVLLLSQRILHEDAYAAGWERVGATVLGASIAMFVVALSVASWRWRRSGADSGQARHSV